jgi:predicted DNA-binding protein (UPF0251 family)/predicted Fe-Mo cluster-binding NifX family protein
MRPCAFKPAGVPARELEHVTLGFDELEALRLADLEGLYQEAAALRMGVSRQTFGRIVETARRKVADAVINRKCLRIEEGDASTRRAKEPQMRIAVPERDGLVDGHFGHCEHFMVYAVDADHGVDLGERVIPPEGCGCKSDIAARLARMGVTHLVAGGMGEGAVRVLNANGIAVVRGASGPAREAAAALARGELADGGSSCAGHEGHGGCGEHGHGAGKGGSNVDVV